MFTETHCAHGDAPGCMVDVEVKSYATSGLPETIIPNSGKVPSIW